MDHASKWWDSDVKIENFYQVVFFVCSLWKYRFWFSYYKKVKTQFDKNIDYNGNP